MKPIAGRAIGAILVLAAFWTAAAETASAEEVLREMLKNGLRVVIVQNALAPVVTTQVNYLVGSNEAPPGFPGMAHAQEHMMFRGSPGLSAAQLANLIAAMGGRFDADTQQTVTQYFFTVPAEDLEIALHIEAVRMRGVLDSEELWAKERGAIEQEVAQDFSKPDVSLLRAAPGGHVRRDPLRPRALGSRSSFQKTTGPMLKEFYDPWYAPNNAVLVIVGDVDPAQALATVKRLFEGTSRRRACPRGPGLCSAGPAPATIKMDTDLPYGLAVVAYRLPGYGDPDYAAGRIMADVLASQRGNLYALVPAGKALVADFEASIFPHAGLGYAMAGFPQGSDGTGLVATLKSIVADYVKQGFPPELVQAVKRAELTEAELQKNSIAGLASAWSDALAVQGLRSPEENIQALEKVTPADVNRVARKYLVNETATVGLLTPAPSGKPTEVKGRGFGGKESFAPSQTQAVTLPEWASKAVALPSIPQSRIQPVDMKLSNGLRLIVQPVTISPTVGVYGRVKHDSDLDTPKGQEGVNDVLEDLFSYGTTSLDRLAFQKALDDIGADASVGASFYLQILDKDFERGVELLADNLLHPALPDSAFEIVRQETGSMVAGQLKSPDYLFGRALLSGLYPADDPTLRQATPQSIAALTLPDVREYYRKVFRPDLTTMVVIGNVTPQKAKEVIARYFGAWQATGEKPATELPPVPLNKAAATAVPDAARVQDLAVLAQTLGLTRSNPDYYTLQVGNHVLSGAFYATRLYRDLREKSGLVYMVESSLDVRKTRGSFEVVYACDPPNVSKARAIVEQDLRAMQTALVTEDELRQAKTILVRGIPLSEASISDIAGKLLYYSLEGLPLDESTRAARRYLETSAAQLQAAFSKWVRPADFVQATLGPDPH